MPNIQVLNFLKGYIGELKIEMEMLLLLAWKVRSPQFFYIIILEERMQNNKAQSEFFSFFGLNIV